MPRVRLHVPSSTATDDHQWLHQLTDTARRLGYDDVTFGAPGCCDDGEQGVRCTFLVFENGTSAEEIHDRMTGWGSRYVAPLWQGWIDRYRLISEGRLVCGTVDQVRRQLEVLLLAHPGDDVVWELDQSAMPRRETLAMLELFAERIVPELDAGGPSLALSGSAGARG
ncbi:MAG: Luciferase-like, subgroup [Solirubrobacterales bacterium]|jgi:hypothetical protein|nr:Luciferase-like, subgroup [Solirubrobacterales bacterium]